MTNENDLIRRGDALRRCYNSARSSEARISALPADDRVAKLVEALEEISKQKRTDELENEYEVECASFEDGYDHCVDRARAAIAAWEAGK